MFIGLGGNEPGLVSYHSFNNANINNPILDEPSNSNDCSSINCDASNIVDSWAVIGDATMETMTDLHGLWNSNGFSTPRFSLTDNGLSLVDTLTDWDYVVFGHDNASGVNSMDLPAGAPASMERTMRTWYVNEIGVASPNFSWNITNAAGSGPALNTALAPTNTTCCTAQEAAGLSSQLLLAMSKTTPPQFSTMATWKQAIMSCLPHPIRLLDWRLNLPAANCLRFIPTRERAA